jgi:hypothetical protein
VAPSAFPGLSEEGTDKSAWATSMVTLIGGVVVLCLPSMLVNESFQSGLYKV